VRQIIPRRGGARSETSSSGGAWWFETQASGPYEPPLPCCGHQTVSRKGHEIVAPVFLKKGPLPTLIAEMPVILFFVRVNQVLVRLWARAMEAGQSPVFVPLSG